MFLATAVLLLAVAVIGLGAGVEVTQTVRARREPHLPEQGTAVQAVLSELDPRPWLVWFGVAALAVFMPGLLVGSTLSAGELTLGVVVLGLAGERGQFLAGFAGTEARRAGCSAVAAAATILGGLVFGSS